MKARSVDARQNVFLSSPPTASTEWRAVPDRHGQRREAAGVANREQDVADDPDDRVVARHVDLAIVHEESIAEIAQPRDGVVVEVGERLAGEVAARHHECGSAEAEQRGGGPGSTGA